MTNPYDRPDAAELIDAVSEFLHDEIKDTVAGPLSFHTRIAINALNIATRELQSGPQHAAAHSARLARFGCVDNAQLAAAIRAGQLDEQYDKLSVEIRQMVWDKINVANPRYTNPYTSSDAREDPDR